MKGSKHSGDCRVEVLLRLTLQDWQGSAIVALNGLSYAVLWIPSIIYGVLIGRKTPALRAAGWLLAISSILSILVLVGISLGSKTLGLLSPLSGVVLLVTLVFLAESSSRGNQPLLP